MTLGLGAGITSGSDAAGKYNQRHLSASANPICRTTEVGSAVGDVYRLSQTQLRTSSLTMAGGGPWKVIGIDPGHIIQGGSTIEKSLIFIARYR